MPKPVHPRPRLVATRKAWPKLLAGLFIALVLAAGAAGLPSPVQEAPFGPDLSAPQDKQKERASGSLVAAPRGKKLVLKDGSFQLVKSYEQKGDRVRYYSVERSTWEEMPSELVDWEATRKAEEDDTRHSQEMLEKARTTEIAARAGEVDVDASIEVAPGIFLPEGEGLYAVDGKTIIPLVSVGADMKLDKKRLLTQVLVPIPVIPTRHRIQVAGKKALVRLTSREPEFYVRTANAREPELELIRAQVKGTARELQLVDTDLVGESTRRAQTISIQRWKVARGVYRLTVSQPLEPGEYALAEFVTERDPSNTSGQTLNFYVWDFGVDTSPSALPKDKK